MRDAVPLQMARPADYCRVLVAYKWMILTLVLVASAATALEVWSRPRLYEAQVEIMLVAQAWENNQAVSIGPVLANLGKPARVLKPVLRESIYWELYSRTLVDMIIEELDLQKHYGRKTMPETRAALEVSRHIRLTNSGTLQVLVVDRDPAMAAAIANAHARQLDRLDQKLGAELVSVRKRFYQKRMDEAFARLGEAEEEWYPIRFTIGLGNQGVGESNGQSGTGTNEKQTKEERADEGLSPSKEERADEGLSPLMRSTKLKLEVMELEVELARLRRFTTPAHPQVTQIEARLRVLRQAIRRIEEGAGTASNVRGRPSIFPSLDRLPQVVLDGIRFGREVTAQTRLYISLRDAFEDVLIEESLNLPRLWVLDWAIPTERQKKVWPTTLVAGCLAVLLGAMLSFLLTYIDRRKVVSSSACSNLPDRLPIRHAQFRGSRPS